jgi:LuxR family maltose regulon positive regulatory protein
VSHALAAQEYERAARLMEQYTLLLLPQGELHALLSWIKALPERVARRRPWLCIYQAWALAFAGQLDSVEALLQDTERLLQAADSMVEKRVGKAERKEMVGHIAAMRAYAAIIHGGASRTVEFANLAHETLSADSFWARSVFQWALGIAYIMLGDLTVADRSFAEMVRLGQAMDNIWITVMGLTDLALIHQERGWLRQATVHYRDALQLATERDAQNLGYMGRVEAGLAQVLYEQNDLVAARRYATASIKKTLGWKNPNHFVFAYGVLARVLQAQGDYQGAWYAIQKADQVKRENPIMPVLSGMNEKNKVRLWLAQDNLEAASQWVQERGLDADGEPPLLHEVEKIVLARILIAQGRLDETARLLQRLIEATEAGGRTFRAIEVLILQALASQAGGDITRAITTLEQALALAEPGGFIRTFVDEGQPMARLLYKAAARGIVSDYAGRLLAAFSVTEWEPTESLKTQAPKSDLIEPLSERELEVLELIAEGLTNQEIASKLFLSLNTVKVHARHIYGKLGVGNRTQAVARARVLGVLPSA